MTWIYQCCLFLFSLFDTLGPPYQQSTLNPHMRTVSEYMSFVTNHWWQLYDLITGWYCSELAAAGFRRAAAVLLTFGFPHQLIGLTFAESSQTDSDTRNMTFSRRQLAHCPTAQPLGGVVVF